MFLHLKWENSPPPQNRQIDKAKNNSLGFSQTGSVTRQVDNPVNALGYLWSSAPEGEKAERSLRKKT